MKLNLRSYVAVLFSCILLAGQTVQPVRRAGATKVNPKDGLTYVWIPPGAFQMGCSPGSVECWDMEKPVHQVTISRGFWMGQTEVTQEAYKWVTGNNPSHFIEPKRPVENISWFDAKSYCQTAGMRLPTDAEWEYAARAGSTGSLYADLDAIAWYSSNSGGTTHPVGGKEANPWGLSDMFGNLAEWVTDWSAFYTPGNATDPQGPANGRERVIRGGNWEVPRNSMRASLRDYWEPAKSDSKTGVRCAGN
jgi:formylglycine-generating enzyme required for sulfatase activity